MLTVGLGLLIYGISHNHIYSLLQSSFSILHTIPLFQLDTRDTSIEQLLSFIIIFTFRLV